MLRFGAHPTSKKRRDFTRESTEFHRGCDSQTHLRDLLTQAWGDDLIACGDFASEHRIEITRIDPAAARKEVNNEQPDWRSLHMHGSELRL